MIKLNDSMNRLTQHCAHDVIFYMKPKEICTIGYAGYTQQSPLYQSVAIRYVYL